MLYDNGGALKQRGQTQMWPLGQGWKVIMGAQLVKHHHTSYPYQPYKSSNPSQLFTVTYRDHQELLI